MTKVDKIFAVLERMEKEDLTQRDRGDNREIRWRSIPRISGELLYQIMMIHQPRIVVEIGMSHGYSTLWLAMAARVYGGTVYSYEVEKWRYKQAERNFKEAGMTDIIIPNLVSAGFSDYPENIDLVFIDAEKGDYLNHIKNVEDKCSSNAVILADNTISHHDELQDYLDYVRQSERSHSVSLPVGKGIECTRLIDIEKEFIQNNQNNITI